MSQVRVRLKHQITLPAPIATAAHIEPNDMLEVTYANGIITLIPAHRKERRESVMHYAGIARGVWGQTSVEIESELKNSRESWER